MEYAFDISLRMNLFLDKKTIRQKFRTQSA